MRAYLTLLLFLLGTAAAFAGEATITVRWEVLDPAVDGKFTVRRLVNPDYISTLATCGHSISSLELDHLSVAQLRCPGILDFSSSSSIRDRLIQRLQSYASSGRNSLQGIPLKTLIEEAARVDFAISRHGIFQGAEKIPRPRSTAINLKNLVIINDVYWQKIASHPDSDAILLHELLGALHYQDSNYQVSLAIFLDLPGQYEIARENESDGGISVVGHGGNNDELLVKGSLLLLAKDNAQSIAMIDAILRTSVLTLPTQFMLSHELCGPARTSQNKFHCGVFLPAQGILITEESGAFPKEIQWELMNKIYADIVGTLRSAKEPQ